MDNYAHWTANIADGMSNDGLQMETLVELQDNNGFEPQTRARSNTWPLPRPDGYVEPCDESESNKCSNQQLAGKENRTVTGINRVQVYPTGVMGQITALEPPGMLGAIQ